MSRQVATDTRGLLDGGPAVCDAPVVTTDAVATELRHMLQTGALELPAPGADTARRWRALAGWARRDLSLARLAEGHTDAVAILREAGTRPVPDALYGVWASRSGPGGPLLRNENGATRLAGYMQFCSGASLLDRALVLAETTDGALLVDIALANPRVRPVPQSWPTVAMNASDSQDVEFDAVQVPPGATIGGPGFYLRRPGFTLGGAGVAAVWLGGATAVLDHVARALSRAVREDPHRLADLGAVHTAVAAAEALAGDAAARIDAAPHADHTTLVQTCRAAAEHAVTVTLRRAVTALGPGPLAHQPALARRLADLQLYVRQHHGERDLATLGRSLLAADPR